MLPEVVLFGMTIDLYSMMISVGLIVVMLLADRVAVKRGFSIALQRGLIISVVLTVTVGLFSAMLFQSLYNYKATGEFAFKGATFYGGLIGGAVVFLTTWFFVLGRFCKDKQEPLKRFADIADIAAVCIPLAHGFGRLGCLCAGCCHGKITDAWYAVSMPSLGAGVKAVPVQLYEALFLFALAATLAYFLFKREKEKRFPLLPIYMVVYGIWRFFIEYVRADSRGETIVSFLTPSQLVAVVLVLGGVAYWMSWYFKLTKIK